MRLAPLVLALSLAASPATAAAPEPIKVGDISSITAGPSYQIPYRKGWQMAVDEINKSGGILGRPLEYVARDDMGKPEEAVRIAQDLIGREHVLWLTGSGLANIELAISDFARANKILYFSASLNGDAFIWEHHHDYAFRLGGPTTTVSNAMLVKRLKKYGPLKWAAINPNYEWGHSNYDAFKEQMTREVPGSTFVTEQWPEANKLKVAETIQAISQHDFNAIYTTLFGHDLLEFFREATKRGLLKGRTVVCLSAGIHETMKGAGAEMPEGMLTFGYPAEEIETLPGHKQFVQKYITTYGDVPDYMAVEGYIYPYFIKSIAEKIGSIDPEKIRAALPGFTADTILGPLTIRAIDHQSTMGAWVGTTAVVNGKPKLVDWSYEDAAAYFPSDDYVLKRQHP